MDEGITCGNCGAPLQVPPGVRFITCNHCHTSLAVHRSETATYTEKLDEIDARTQEMAGELAQLRNESRAGAARSRVGARAPELSHQEQRGPVGRTDSRGKCCHGCPDGDLRRLLDGDGLAHRRRAALPCSACCSLPSASAPRSTPTRKPTSLKQPERGTRTGGASFRQSRLPPRRRRSGRARKAQSAIDDYLDKAEKRT